MRTVLLISGIIGTIITVLCAYRFIYDVIGFFKVKKYPDAKVDHEYGILIAARNEANVIGQLIKSILACDYDQSKIRIFVVADNCTDNTAQIARDAGATVFERFNKQEIGKGYALNHLLAKIHEAEPEYLPEAWMIFDADNLLDKNYIKEMNKAFDAGEEIITSLRNGKNFNTNWVSAINCMAFMRECRFTQAPRSVLNISAKITGTGWLAKNTIINYEIGFPWHFLTEDCQFTNVHVLKDKRIAYQDSAVFYDEQPTNFKVVYKQRLRWQSGYYQNLRAYLGGLFAAQFHGNFRRRFEAYDHFVSMLPLDLFGTLIAIANIITQVVLGILMITGGATVWAGLWYIARAILLIFAGIYFGAFVYGVLVHIKDWKRMAANTKFKLVSMFTYPIFVIMIMPISIIALFRRAKWVEIPHKDERTIAVIDKDLAEMNEKNKKEK